MADPHNPTRRELLRNAGRGAAVLAVAGLTVATTAAPAEAIVPGWRWCRRCQGMWFTGSARRHCPVLDLFEHFHYDSGSAAYSIWRAPEITNGQPGWHWCWNCAIMWYWGSGEHGRGVCPNDRWGTGHFWGDPFGTNPVRDSYRLEAAPRVPVLGGQSRWYWCKKCNGLFYGGNGIAVTHCPAGGNHDSSGSMEYFVRN